MGAIVNIVITSLSGKEVFSKRINFEKETIALELPESISSGAYVITVKMPTQTYTQKVIMK